MPAFPRLDRVFAVLYDCEESQKRVGGKRVRLLSGGSLPLAPPLPPRHPSSLARLAERVDPACASLGR